MKPCKLTAILVNNRLKSQTLYNPKIKQTPTTAQTPATEANTQVPNDQSNPSATEQADPTRKRNVTSIYNPQKKDPPLVKVPEDLAMLRQEAEQPTDGQQPPKRISEIAKMYQQNVQKSNDSNAPNPQTEQQKAVLGAVSVIKEKISTQGSKESLGDDVGAQMNTSQGSNSQRNVGKLKMEH